MTIVWHFQCKDCGMITDNPAIVPHPDKDKEYRDKMSHYKGCPSAFSLVGYPPYNHSITCPVCQNETRFWREEPFPTDKEDNIDLASIPTRVI